jgi:type IV secretion system protein VirB5
MSMKRIMIALALGLPGIAQAQMAVIDSAGLAKALQTARNTLQQVQTATKQLGEAQRLYSSLNHITDLSSATAILNNGLVQRGLPAGVGSSARLISNDLSQLGDLGRRAQSIVSQRDFSTGTIGNAADQGISILDKAQGAARDQAMAETTLDVAGQRSTGLSNLSSRLTTAADAKEVQDIAARATIEAAQATNQTNQLMAMQMQKDADGRSLELARQAKSERDYQSFAADQHRAALAAGGN